MKKRFSVLAVPAVLAVLAVGAAPDTTPGTIRAKGRQIEFPAVVTKDSFEREMLGMGMAGYHLIVWEDGRASHAALFRAQVTDVQVLDALEKLGARPGNALPMETWDERKNPESKAPDKIIQGPPV